MDKRIEDYLHLYLPSRVQCLRQGEEDAAVMVGICYDDTQRIWWVYFEDAEDKENDYAVLSDVAPILRPLSDMTEDVLRELFDVCYAAVYDYAPEPETEYIVIEVEDEVGLKAIYGKWHYGLSVNGNGVLFSCDGAYLTTPVFETTRILLSKHFDLFQLIESGLALDITKR